MFDGDKGFEARIMHSNVLNIKKILIVTGREGINIELRCRVFDTANAEYAV